jgi:hypothetical protein
LPFARQFPSGDLLPVTVPNLAYMIDNFSAFTRDQYIKIASAHAIQVTSVDRKDHVRDLLCVHICDQACAPNLILFKHLKVTRCNYSHVILPVPFETDHCSQRTAAQHLAHVKKADDEQPLSHSVTFD